VSPKLILRGAALVTVLLTAGHTLGSPWTPGVDPSAHDVVAAMQAYRFDVMGLRVQRYAPKRFSKPAEVP
jgi:hypothetical protein